MLQYIITGLAGIALGIVGMRVWQAQQAPAASGAEDGAVTASAEPASEAAAIRSPALSTRNLLIGAAVLVAAAILVFAVRSPDSGPAVAAPTLTAAGAPGKNLDDVDTMIDRLAKRLEANPDDGEGLRMLGWSYVMTGRPDKAIEPYKRAIKLLPNQAIVHSGYGEALVAVAKNTVTPDAKKAFEKAVTLDASEPRARYFLALWQAQNGQEKEALEKWIALANSGPADAPWQADVHRQIAQTSEKLGVDVTARLNKPALAAASTQPPVLDAATVQAVSQLPEEDRKGMIDGMVDGLANKLKTDPTNSDRWVMLLRSRMVLKQAKQAGEELSIARKALSSDAAGLKKVNAAATQLGVPGA